MSFGITRLIFEIFIFYFPKNYIVQLGNFIYLCIYLVIISRRVTSTVIKSDGYLVKALLPTKQTRSPRCYLRQLWGSTFHGLAIMWQISEDPNVGGQWTHRKKKKKKEHHSTRVRLTLTVIR